MAVQVAAEVTLDNKQDPKQSRAVITQCVTAEVSLAHTSADRDVQKMFGKGKGGKGKGKGGKGGKGSIAPDFAANLAMKVFAS